MLKKIENLPADILGFSASGMIRQDDYDSVLLPALDEQYRLGEKVRILYQLEKDFTGFTPRAAWSDFKVGLKYLQLFEKCAVVGDVSWIRNATQLMAPFIPCPMRMFGNADFETAVDWLESNEEVSNIDFELSDDGIMFIRPTGPLRREDFNSLSRTVDPWLETHKKLKGVVVSIEKFPGWENFGSFVRHIEFVSAHQKKVKRVAITIDGKLPEMISKIADHFVSAEIKQFPYDQLDQATKWVRLGEPTSRSAHLNGAASRPN